MTRNGEGETVAVRVDMDSSSDSLLEQIGRDFRFLVSDHGFVPGSPQRSGDVTTIRYEHPLAIIQFTVRHGEWRTLIYPAPPQLIVYQASLDLLHRQQTRASSRMSWSMRWLDNRTVQLSSSDVGTTCWQEQDDGAWPELPCP